MISVDQAVGRVSAAFARLEAEEVALGAALGRVLAEDVRASLCHPRQAVSAMDGYAVRSRDVRSAPVTLRVVGESPAGGAYGGRVGAGEAVRIFTGGPVPAGADAVVIQEKTEKAGDSVLVLERAAAGDHIRPEGLDFKKGDVGIPAGRRLCARDIALAAAMNTPSLSVTRKPRIAILSTGDEIVVPGTIPGPHQIIGSNGPGLIAFVRECGGEPVDLGIAGDDEIVIRRRACGALKGTGGHGADMLVTTGGVSVGDHDLVQSALAIEVDFWKVAMRPGKPVLFGRFKGIPMLGLPGNPVSVMVCAVVYLKAAMAKMLGIASKTAARAVLACDLGANDERQHYLRVRLFHDGEGNLVAEPFPRQDSAMLCVLSRADGLIVRPPLAPPVKAGEHVPLIPLCDPFSSI